jgi:hypothetical protein
MPEANLDIVHRYRAASDEVILAALATGQEGYNPVAWDAITAEAARRSLRAPSPAPADVPEAPPADQPEPLPPWLSATLLALAGLFLLLQVLLILAFYGVIDTEGTYFGSTGSLALGLTAVAATRFVRVGPHSEVARKLGVAAIVLTVGTVLLRAL